MFNTILLRSSTTLSTSGIARKVIVMSSHEMWSASRNFNVEMMKNYFSMREFSSNLKCMSVGYKNPNSETVNITFVDPKNNIKKTVKAPIGEHLLAVAHANDIDLEGACEASLACSTCHVYIQDEYFDKCGEPEEEEEDMLDLAYGLAHNSRLGCQVFVTKELEGMTVTLPKATRNMQVDKKK
ncbi:hypothetical protein C9374_007084 [Naegleria lovaniensis]|uniref:2Fe-2S ferredoxin-type domain-containing protein n=1 Tax=Naegleria lovaniensis TaxID=51637 RepID=A0AA88H2W8_NAELO|nr:uncharacterized protein C9374_007084 [Naegleria lovaniensis]KAG2393553.1 hypothetical protein C9374_007084 [Naegleria lovaniensis]